MRVASNTVAVIGWLLVTRVVEAFSSATTSSCPSMEDSVRIEEHPVGNVLILDHLNINHEKGRHDWVKAFYFDFLKCAVDPRKKENLEAGSGTVWSNIGANQFHLPEGKPDAQVLHGIVTLSFSSIEPLLSRLEQAEKALNTSRFRVLEQDSRHLLVKDPWGTTFRIVQGASHNERDVRGTQPGASSEGMAIRDLTIYTPNNNDDNALPGIARFYNHVLGCPILELSDHVCRVSVGPRQTLTFVPNGVDKDIHVDMRESNVPEFLSNYGPHVSVYVADPKATYQRAEQLGLTYVNPRFKRRAYTLEQALDDCMFRCLDIVDPENTMAGPILKLEHEIRSVVKPDGSKYKSCPFHEIPDTVVMPNQ